LSVDEREQADFSKSEQKTLERLRWEFDKWQSGMKAYPAAE